MKTNFSAVQETLEKICYFLHGNVPLVIFSSIASFSKGVKSNKI